MASSSSTSKKIYYNFEANAPVDVHQLIDDGTLHERLQQKIFRYQSIILSNYGAICHYIQPMGIHPDHPYAHLYRIGNTNMPEEVLCFLWYICAVYTIGIAFDIKWLYHYINTVQGEKDCFSTFLTWFAPLTAWNSKLRRSAKATNIPFKKLKKGGLNPFFNPHTIYFFHRPVQVNTKSNKLHSLPTLIHHGDYHKGIRPDFNLHDNKTFEDFQTHAFRLNNARQSYPVPFIPNWTHYPVDYQMTLDEDVTISMIPFDKASLDVSKNKQESTSQDCPAEYFQDAQLPDDDINLEEIGKTFNFDIEIDTEEIKEFEEPEYECPDDHYGCCEEHMLEFEMDH